jgi:hypothetical protein
MQRDDPMPLSADYMPDGPTQRPVHARAEELT